MNKQTVQVDVIETTIYNEKPELKKLECIGCGGSLDTIDNTHAICPHCGRNYKIKHANSINLDLWIDSEGIDQMQPMLTKVIIIAGLVLAVVLMIMFGIISYNARQLGM